VADDVGASLLATTINFETNHIKALVVTHVHIDHVGRIPYLLAKGFKGPIYCSEPSAHLLPLVLEDALKVGFTRNKKIIEQFLSHIEKQIIPVPYNKWQKVSDNLQIKLKPAGHILGSAYVLCKLKSVGACLQANGVVGDHLACPASEASVLELPTAMGTVTDKSVRASLLAKSSKTILFSGDLGAPYSPILKSPKPPFGCDILVMESTYGDKNHENRKYRRQRLKAIIEKALHDQGTVLIPAFSIGRTQELLYELEEIINENKVGASLPACPASEASAVGIAKDDVRGYPVADNLTANPQLVRASLLAKDDVRGHPVADNLTANPQPVRASLLATSRKEIDWNNLEIIIDSPLAAKFTSIYSRLSQYWDKEARRKLKNQRKPLNYNNVLTINSHQEHMTTVEYLAKTKRPAIVIAASGMCNGGRIMNYLKAMLNDSRHDVLFVGYQAKGTIGRIIQKYGPKGGYVDLDGQRITIQAKIHTIGGYSAHAGQKDLLNFVRRMWKKPNEIRLIHGDQNAKQQLQQILNKKHPKIHTWIPEE
jgi:metallo-beta-lactamase family protein